VVNLRFTLLLALLESAGVVAVFVLSFACVIFYFIWYVVTMSASNVRNKLSIFSWHTASWRTVFKSEILSGVMASIRARTNKDASISYHAEIRIKWSGKYRCRQ
jgi:hypothetical protein